MNFSDIFKKSFLEGYASSDIGVKTAIIALLIACVFAMYIFLVYRVLTRKAFYSKTFNISLAMITVITAAIILTIQSSIVVSLGMVGALSIVRFRTAIKDPMDLVFLFWAISVGIICGCGLSEIAVILSLILTIGIVVLDAFPGVKESMVLVVNSNDIECEEQILEAVKQNCKYFKVKSRNMTDASLDLVIEVRTGEESRLVKETKAVAHVMSVALLSHEGELR